jgi:Mrp family chromosome partitioning ATPase/capsular polysaccharide biosynthesis protein
MHPGSEHESSSLSGYLRILRRRKWVILVCAILVPTAAYIASVQQASKYRASAQVYLSSQDLAGALTGIGAGYVDEVRLATTQAKLAHIPAVASRALKLAPVEGMTPGALLGSTTITPQSETNILSFTVTTTDPQAAMRLATAYAQAFTKYRGELESEPVRRARAEIQTKLKALTADSESDKALANNLREKDQELATLEALQTSRTYVIGTADGAAKVSPQPRRNAAVGLALGLILGIGLAFAIEALDTRVRSAGEINHYLRWPLLGRLPPPAKKLQKADQLAMVAQPSGSQAEAFRVLRTNLDFARLTADDVKTILITSSVEQEGKSTTAANLAVALARSGKRTCLVDLDLRRPYLHKFFQIVSAPGITDVALGLGTLDDALVDIDLATGEPQPAQGPFQNAEAVDTGCIHVLITGPLPPDPGEFVATRKLGEVLRELRHRYDIVVLDTPPLLRVGDAMTLSSRVDGLLVMTRLNTIKRPMLRELARVLEAAPTTKLGYVVTGSQRQAGYPGSYGYGYGYGDAYYARVTEAAGPEEKTDPAGNGRRGVAREEETV